MGSGRGRGGMTCTQNMSKCLLFIFNAVFFLLGLVSLIVGIWVLVDSKSFMKLTSFGLDKLDSKANISTTEVKTVAKNYVDSSSLLQICAYVMITIGAFNFLVGFCGCYGACKEMKGLLYIYTILIGLILLVEIAGAVIAIVFKEKLESQLEKELSKSLNTFYMGVPNGLDKKDDPQSVISLAWDYAHVLLGCCGVTGPDDFNKTNNLWYKSYRKYDYNGYIYQLDEVFIPTTCCNMTNKDLVSKAEWKKIEEYMRDKKCPVGANPGSSTEPIAYNSKGCVQAMNDTVAKYATILIIAAIVIAIIELLGVVLACCVIRGIKEDSSANAARA